MKYKMIECSNKNSVGLKMLGKIDSLILEERFYFGVLKSSPIEKIQFKKNLIIIKTKNTKYTFKK